MNYKNVSKEIYKKFSEIEGNQNIAGDYAIEKILSYIEKFKIKNILEVGLGIGSISDAILTFSKKNDLNIQYSGTEANDFCLNALKNNVTFYTDIQLYESIEKLPKTNKYDFIIVDGSDESIEQIKNYCTTHALIFIEGGRASQVHTLKESFPNYRSTEVISSRKPPIYGPFQQKWTGGGTLIAINPTSYQKFFIFKEKVKTYCKRRMRKFKN